MNPEITNIISGLRAAVEKSEKLKDTPEKSILDDLKKSLKDLGIKKEKPECRFINVDGRGVYHYVLHYNGAFANFDLAPEHASAFKSMAMHFLNEVKNGDKISFISDPGLMNQMGNMLNPDEACAPSPAADPEVSFDGRIADWFRRGM